MFRVGAVIPKHLAVVAISLALVAPFATAGAKDRFGTLHGFSTLYVFKGGSDGATPHAGLLPDQAGNLYGTTQNGGDTSCAGNEGSGCGTVFELKPDGTKIVLRSFTGGSDGAYPFGGVIADQGGNLYGTTLEGGYSGCDREGYGCGTVFKVALDGTETILHSFRGGAVGDGAAPEGGLIEDKAGNLYGTTYGGSSRSGHPGGNGTAFKITPNGTETVMRIGGKNPEAGLVMDDAGNLYGTSGFGGDDPFCNGNGNGEGCGVVFKISPRGRMTVIHTFHGATDGAYPFGGLILDQTGNLYGTTWVGGTYDAGTIYKLDSSGTETILYNFTGGSDGGGLRAGLVMDRAGNLYGTAADGGLAGCGDPFGSACGTVFKLSPIETLTVLHSFRSGRDGAHPFATLIADGAGYLYGTTIAGGDNNCPTGENYGCGTVFRLRK
jgi:uncharacterized repeat protein (TIGR03803 family)